MAMTGNRFLLGFAVGLIIAIGALAAFAWSGVYGIGADDPHSRPVSAFLASVRDRAVRARAAKLEVPRDLSSEVRIRQGAGNYDAMCATCHLSPGSAGSELNRGLYPAPPRLDVARVDAAQAFWVVKHGIKASGMPAWGKSMNDEYIWNMVAFLGALPGLDAGQYQTLVAASGGHSHDGQGTDDHGDHEHRSPDHHDEAELPDVPEAARDAVAVVDAFGTALVAGDLGKAKLLLDPRVIVLEAGGAQRSREEYMSDHAVADARFLRGAHVQVTRRIARTGGDMAWVATESTIHAHGDKPASSLSTETMVLERKGNAWRIVQIHWSSQER